MADEHSGDEKHMIRNSTPKKKENIRVFVQRKRLSSGVSQKSSSSRSNSFENLTSVIEKHLNINKKNARNNKNIILINYKPVFINSRQQKSIPTSSSINNNSTPVNLPNQQHNVTKTPNIDKINRPENDQSVSFDVPDVEDPLMFIEMMYQQLFTDDGQLRNGTETEVLANCVKQIVTHSRRNSMAHRDATLPNMCQRKCSMPSKTTSLSSSPHCMPHTFSEEEEEEGEEEDNKFNTLPQRNRTANTSRRSSKRSSMDHTDRHQQQLHAFLNSYYHHQKRPSINPTRIKSDNLFSVDDTDNEDFDTFSDLNSYRKTIRTSPPISNDEDTIHTDSKLLSSGYQSLRSHQLNIRKTDSKCFTCTQTSASCITLPISIIQPIREIFSKYFNFILITKNILLVPLCIFILHQRSIHLRN